MRPQAPEDEDARAAFIGRYGDLRHELATLGIVRRLLGRQILTLDARMLLRGRRESIAPVSFVPMQGEAEDAPD